MVNLKDIDKSWALFLDRDGVINDEKHLDYINSWEEFKIYDGVLEAIRIFSEKFGRIFIVTNQKGVAKGITKKEDLELIHNNLLQLIIKAKGHIDKIYYCPDMESNRRKPNPGMGLDAKRDFPDISFSKSIMIGNTLSDMQFGRNIGVASNIFLPTTQPEVDVKDPLIDGVYPDLISFAKVL